MDLSAIPQLGRSVVLNRKVNSYITGDKDTSTQTKGNGMNDIGGNGPPPLITKDSDGMPIPTNESAPHPVVPMCIQPSLCHKDFVVYFAADSQ